MIDFTKRLARLAGSVSLGIATAACSTTAEPERVSTTSVAAESAGQVAIDVPPAGYVPGPALWRIGDEDTTIYLFGTVHALPEATEWYDERIARAFTSSSELVTEIDMVDQVATAQAIALQAVLPADQNLRELMSDENRVEYEDALVTMGLPLNALDRVKPWFAAMTLSLLPLIRSGYSPDTGVEMALEGRASEKTRSALETVDDQVALFDTLPQDAQLEYLDQTVAAIPEATFSLDAMVAEWVEGDAVELAEMLNAEMDNPALYQRLLVDRNARWADWIENRLDMPGTVFVAVGAGHLAGRGSVQDQLTGRGHEVTRIWE